jgi:hypothetical protein
MTMKKTLIILLAGAMVLSVGTANAAKKKKKPKKSGPVVVFEDPAGDAGLASQSIAVPGADAAGFDLIKGTINRAGKNLEFTAEHAAMPEGGTLPEGFRMLWHFSVDGEEYRFTIKSADVGKPDAQAQSGTERLGQVDTDGHFRLEQCVDEPLPAVLTLVQCRVVEDGYLDGSFDPAKASVTVILPLELVDAKPGSEIAPGTGGAASTSCVVCWVPHYAERSLTPHTIIDYANVSGTYKVTK